MNDFVIVGSGICGLELGAMLAHDGHRVKVLEKSSHYGGRAFLWEKDGFIVDNGIHLIRFGPKSATAQVFQHLGQDLQFKDLGISYVLDEDGKVKDFPTSPAGFLTTKMMSITERFKTIGLVIKMRRQDPGSLLETSVEDWMMQTGLADGVRRYLIWVTASMQVCPFTDRASMGELILNFQAVLKKGKSAMYPIHGWKPIYDALVSEIEREGEIRLNAKVDSVVVKDGRATGVMVGEELIEAERVVVNLPCQQIFSVIDERNVDPAFVNMCKKQRPTAGVVLDYGLSRKISNDSGLWYMWQPMSFGMFTSNLCPEVAPKGKQLLTWFYPTNIEDMQDLEKARKKSEEMEQALHRLFPELEKAIQWRRVQHLQTVDGAEINVNQHRNKRPGYMVPGISNLYLVGDSLKGPGAGGDVGHESVLQCYEEITGRQA